NGPSGGDAEDAQRATHSRPSASSRLVAGGRSKVREKRGRYLRRGKASFRRQRWRFAIAKAAGRPRRAGDKCLDFAEQLLPLPVEPAAHHPDRRAPASLAPKEVCPRLYPVRRRRRWRKANVQFGPNNR